jgi:hypothetical protein
MFSTSHSGSLDAEHDLQLLNSLNSEIQRSKRSIPSHSQSKWLRGVRHQSGLLGLWVQIQLWHGCLSLVSVVHCQVQVSALGCTLVQRNPTECDGVSECDCEALIMRRPWPTRGCCAGGGICICVCVYIYIYFLSFRKTCFQAQTLTFGTYIILLMIAQFLQ